MMKSPGLFMLLVAAIISMAEPQTDIPPADGEEGGVLPRVLMSLLSDSRALDGGMLTEVRQLWPEVASAISRSADAKHNVSQACLMTLAYITKSPEALALYVDASGKVPPGILTGNNMFHGSFEECMLVPNSHYCTVTNLRILSKPILLSLCVPSACSGDDIEALISIAAATTNDTFIALYEDASLLQTYQNYAYCTDGKAKIKPGTIFMIILLCILGLLCLLGTSIDLYREHQGQNNDTYMQLQSSDDATVQKSRSSEEPELKAPELKAPASMHAVLTNVQGSAPVRFLLCFSLLRNSRALFELTSPPGAITCINGMRTLSMSWVMLAHTFAFLVSFQSTGQLGRSSSSTENIVDAFMAVQTWTMQAILNASVSVDSFFFLSGLLVSYLSMKRYLTTGSLPLLRYYVHRYIRLTPPMMLVVLLSMYVIPSIGSGPYWVPINFGGPFVEPCYKHWWTNLLYINNFYPKHLEEECLIWGWYLANDMQFYIISPLILYLMYRFKLLGTLLVNGLIIFICVLINGVLIGAKHLVMSSNLKGQTPIDPSQTEFIVTWLYLKPWTRIAPYSVGLALGYILITKKKITGKYAPYVIAAGWLVAAVTALSVLYGPYSSKTHDWSRGENVMYGMLCRFSWACALAWVVYACHNGYGSVVDKLLSWKAWVPLSRLTYGAYLLHPLVALYLYSSVTAPIHFTMIETVFHFLGILVISFLLSYLLAMSVEYPVFNMEQLYLRV